MQAPNRRSSVSERAAPDTDVEHMAKRWRHRATAAIAVGHGRAGTEVLCRPFSSW